MLSRTVEAIRDYLKVNPSKSNYLFAARAGAKMSSESLPQAIVSAGDRANGNGANIPKQVTFEGLRDNMFSIPGQVPFALAMPEWALGLVG